jgi:hypothetical protein
MIKWKLHTQREEEMKLYLVETTIRKGFYMPDLSALLELNTAQELNLKVS